MRARRSTPSISAGVFAAAYALRIGTRLLETLATLGEGAALEEAWLCFVVPTVVSEPEIDLASSSRVAVESPTCPCWLQETGGATCSLESRRTQQLRLE